MAATQHLLIPLQVVAASQQPFPPASSFSEPELMGRSNVSSVWVLFGADFWLGIDINILERRHYYCHAYLGPPTGSCPSLFTPQFEAHVAAAAVNPARSLARRPSSSLVAVAAFIGKSGHVGRNDNSLRTGGGGGSGGREEREGGRAYPANSKGPK